MWLKLLKQAKVPRFRCDPSPTIRQVDPRLSPFVLTTSDLESRRAGLVPNTHHHRWVSLGRSHSLVADHLVIQFGRRCVTNPLFFFFVFLFRMSHVAPLISLGRLSHSFSFNRELPSSVESRPPTSRESETTDYGIFRLGRSTSISIFTFEVPLSYNFSSPGRSHLRLLRPP
jgi:hypothetical protein